MLLSLVLAVCLQTNYTAQDIMMMRAETEFIMNANKVDFSVRLESLVNTRIAKLVRILGNPKNDARELAKQELIKYGDTAVRGLLFGLFHPDNEVAMYSASILYEEILCKWCSGTGRCGTCGGHKNYNLPDGSYRYCNQCDGVKYVQIGKDSTNFNAYRAQLTKCNFCKGNGLKQQLVTITGDSKIFYNLYVGDSVIVNFDNLESGSIFRYNNVEYFKVDAISIRLKDFEWVSLPDNPTVKYLGKIATQ